MVTHQYTDGLRAWPWWVKALLCRCGIIAFRPDCIRGLTDWHQFDGYFATSEFVQYDHDISSGQHQRVYHYLESKHHLNETSET